MTMNTPATIASYNAAQAAPFGEICTALADSIHASLKESEGKIWHGAPVWFLQGNPVVGYWVRKEGVQLLFWSGQSFREPQLKAEGSFKAAEKRYDQLHDIDHEALVRWLQKAEKIQWDYKNIVKRRGKLEKLTDFTE